MWSVVAQCWSVKRLCSGIHFVDCTPYFDIGCELSIFKWIEMFCIYSAIILEHNAGFYKRHKVLLVNYGPDSFRDVCRLKDLETYMSLQFNVAGNTRWIFLKDNSLLEFLAGVHKFGAQPAKVIMNPRG